MNVKTTKNLGKVIALSLITSTVLHATNGDTLISVGTKARGMGGVGIAMSHGAESGLSNPALITIVKNSEISFGGTVFMPDISTQIGPFPKYDSDNDLNVIPAVSMAHKFDENWYLGLGMWGTAGMGVDFGDVSPTQTDPYGNLQMSTTLQLMQFGVPIAYKTEGLSVAVAPILQWGSLDINYVMPTGDQNMPYMGVGSGQSQDFAFGVNVGATYDFGNGLTVGAVYKSKIEMDYDNQLSNATGAFPVNIGNNLEQPAEFGAGLAYAMGQHTFAFDYKQIQWGDATGYEDFGWDDQDVYAFGYQYTQDNWALRAGYNYAEHPINDLIGLGAEGASLNTFNILGFPATAEKHYTIGATYGFSDAFSLDLAYVYADETSETLTTALPDGQGGFLPANVDHSEDSISFQLTYNF